MPGFWSGRRPRSCLRKSRLESQGIGLVIMNARNDHAFCVCIPARDEEERLPRLLAALANQTFTGPIPVAICLNNCSDGSAAAVAAAGSHYAGRLLIAVESVTFPPELAHAGSARAAAMTLGLRQLPDGQGILITTDADARPPEEWIAANLAAIVSGDEIVGGRLLLDDGEPLPDGVAEASRLWHRYWEAVRAIEDEIDPMPWDPPPRHGDHTGGSLALSADLYRRAGGVPLLRTGEDRALVEAAIKAGGRLIHPVSVWTRVSARSDGRAENGMALTMRRLEDPLSRGQGLRAPALAHWRERALWRRRMRRERGDIALIEAERALPPMPHDADLATDGTML